MCRYVSEEEIIWWVEILNNRCTTHNATVRLPTHLISLSFDSYMWDSSTIMCRHHAISNPIFALE